MAREGRHHPGLHRAGQRLGGAGGARRPARRACSVGHHEALRLRPAGVTTTSYDVRGRAVFGPLVVGFEERGDDVVAGAAVATGRGGARPGDVRRELTHVGVEAGDLLVGARLGPTLRGGLRLRDGATTATAHHPDDQQHQRRGPERRADRHQDRDERMHDTGPYPPRACVAEGPRAARRSPVGRPRLFGPPGVGTDARTPITGRYRHLDDHRGLATVLTSVPTSGHPSSRRYRPQATVDHRPRTMRRSFSQRCLTAASAPSEVGR